MKVLHKFKYGVECIYIRRYASPVAQRKRSKLEDGRCQVQTPVSLVDLAFGVFRGFLRNSRKYGLGSLRKYPTEHSLSTRPGSTSGHFALLLQSNPERSYKNSLMKS